ncbi:hypothetical protein E2C01_071758 [Portunus trituberculatus]|uniref:Uncharacterized protein n=1 Tax=Portunus trituberculatus TaxID=210409 RepID=A0A5B7I721_PORTR|nr:hypothetical protein [Portunus trituberculatus]
MKYLFPSHVHLPCLGTARLREERLEKECGGKKVISPRHEADFVSFFIKEESISDYPTEVCKSALISTSQLLRSKRTSKSQAEERQRQKFFFLCRRDN